MTKSDPLAALERLRSVLDEKRPTSQQLADASDRLLDIIAAANSELESIEGLMDSAADSAPVEAEKTLEKLDERARAAKRRIRIAESVLRAIEARRDEALEDERAAKRQAAYDAARRLHIEATQLIKAFLDKIGQEGRDALKIYRDSEAATAAVNRDLPPGASPIPSIEQERMGAAPPPKVTERPFRAFTSGGRFVAEHGSVEASPAAGNTWTLFFASNSLQGGETLGGCLLEEWIDLRIEKFEPSRPASLASGLSIPSFHAPAPIRGSVERKRMRLDEWRQISGEPDHAETAPALAVE
jgi:hypothetical protein